jgi:hypothetical protein
MANWLARLFGSSQPQSLEDIQASGNHFELIPANSGNPEYLVAHGQIAGVGSNPYIDVKTAIVTRNNEFEFTTTVGQIPNSTLGLAVTEALNHRFNGKFVNFQQETPSSTDVVYVTQQHLNTLTLDSLNKELENHAVVKALVLPVLSDAEKQAQGVETQNIYDVAKSIVVNNLVSTIENLYNPYVPITVNQLPEKNQE